MSKVTPLTKEMESKESARKRRRENPQLNTLNLEITCEVLHGEYNNPWLRYRRMVTKSQLINILTTYTKLHFTSEHYNGLELKVVAVEDFIEIVTQLNKVKTKC